jgi:hypothetical protein
VNNEDIAISDFRYVNVLQAISAWPLYVSAFQNIFPPTNV